MDARISSPTWRALRLAAGRDEPWPAAGDEVGWASLVRSASDARVAPLLAWRCAADRRAVPEALRRARLAALVRAEAQAAVAGLALDALAARGVVPIALKGADLARRVYPSPELRPMVDLDFLVGDSELEVAEEALVARGFRSARERSGRLVAREVEVERGKVRIELRSTLSQYPRWNRAFPIDTAAMRRRALDAELAGRRVRRLEDADHLLYLLYHLGVVHLFRGPLWFLDLDRLLETAGTRLGWAAFERRAHAWGLAACAATGLDRVRRGLDSAVPDDVLARLRRVRRGGGLIGAFDPGAGALRREAGRFLLSPSAPKGLAALLEAAFPPRDWLAYRWGDPNRGYASAWLRHLRRG